MEGVGIKEKRRFPRLNEHIFILCQSIEKQNMNMLKGFSKNISAGGLMFETDKLIRRQDTFTLEIYQPSKQSRQEIISITTLAKVKWVSTIHTTDKYEGPNKYRIGVEFVRIDSEDRKTIAKYVEAK